MRPEMLALALTALQEWGAAFLIGLLFVVLLSICHTLSEIRKVLERAFPAK